MDGGGAVGGEIGYEVGHLFGLVSSPDRDPALQLDVDGPITLDEASLTRIAATNGVGIGYFMETDVREDIAAGRLIRILEDWTPPLVPLCLYYFNRRNPSAAFQAFIALARDFATGRLAQP
jgi:DNA-binding transcriptional LysR family regulator